MDDVIVAWIHNTSIITFLKQFCNPSSINIVLKKYSTVNELITQTTRGKTRTWLERGGRRQVISICDQVKCMGQQMQILSPMTIFQNASLSTKITLTQDRTCPITSI